MVKGEGFGKLADDGSPAESGQAFEEHPRLDAQRALSWVPQ